MSSGNYYVEYEYNYAKKILAVQNGKRMDYTMLQSQPNTALAVLGFINPLFAIAGFLGGGEKKVPSTLYQDGKYYQFESKKKATMAYYNQLDDPNIDPAAGWNMVRVKLALSEALVTFAPNDVFNSFTGFKAPRFIESDKKTFGKKEFNYDKYSTTYNNMNGQPMYKKNFYMLYDFDGKMHVKVPGTTTNAYTDMGGAWLKCAIGTSAKLGKNNSYYIDLEKDFGSKVEKPWSISAGYIHTW